MPFRHHPSSRPAQLAACSKLLILSGLVAATGSPALAVNYFWDPAAALGTGSGGTGNWNTTAGNTVWSDAAVDNVWANGNTAIFSGTAGTVTVNGAVSAAGMTFIAPGYVIGGSTGITMTGGMTVNASPGSTTTINAPMSVTAAQTWNISAGNTLNIGGVVTANGSGNVIFAGAGTVNVTSSAFTVNKFTINAGSTLNFSGTATIPAGGGYTGAGDGTAGTLNMTAGSFTTAAAVFLGNGTTGALNLSGGTFTMTGNLGLVLGDGYNNNGNGAGTLSISNTGTFNTGVTTGTFYLGNATGGTGTINLDGGTLATNRTITRSTYSGIAGTGAFGVINFNGGTLKATGTALAVTGLTNAYVRNGGAVIDTNGFNVTIAQAISHSAQGGDNAIDGGLTKNGNGVLTLSGASTFTGNTVVTAGTLNLTGSLFGTAHVDITGTLAGTGTITTAAGPTGLVSLLSGGHLSPGNNGAGVLTMAFSGGGLNLTAGVSGANSGAMVFELGPTTGGSDQIVTTGGLLTIGAGQLEFADFAFSPIAGFDSAGTYTLFAGDTAIAGTLGASTMGTINGQSFQLQLADNNTDLVLVSVPEPGSAVLLLGGVGALVARRRRGKRWV